MNEFLAENYTFMNVMGALAGLGIPIKEALRGFCNKIVTRLKHVSFPQKVDRQTASEASSTQCVTHFRVRINSQFIHSGVYFIHFLRWCLRN